MAKLKFYITERHNPQLKKSYFNARGQITKKRLSEIINGAVYGYHTLYGEYDNEADYKAAIDNLKKQGYNVY